MGGGRCWTPDGTYAACATATGGVAALVRVSGAEAFAVAARAGLPASPAWRDLSAEWDWGDGPCPCRIRRFPALRSATGCDLVEILLPGSRDLVEAALDRLIAAGCEAAPPGAFARQALANRRLSLDQAEAVVALADSADGEAAAAALGRLRSGLAPDLEAVRGELLGWRAAVEAGLDFAEEPDVQAFDPDALRAACRRLAARLERWRTAADAAAGGGRRVGLFGPANAGKSSLFAALTGEPALVDAAPGTTRDWLEGRWQLPGGIARLIDTAGWTGHDTAPGFAGGLAELAACDVVLICQPPGASPPADPPPTLPAHRLLRIATKADLGVGDPAVACAVSAATGEGLASLARLVEARLAAAPAGLARQQDLLARAGGLLGRLATAPPADELLAEDLRATADALGAITGSVTDEQVMAAVFSRFCIGK